MSDTEKNSGDDTVSIASGGSTKSKKDANKESDKMVSLSEFLSFFPTFKVKVIFALGIFAAFLNGLTFPILAYACKYGSFILQKSMRYLIFLYITAPTTNLYLKNAIFHATNC